MSKKAAPTASPATSPAADGNDPVSRFEASLKELEEIVARMERGDLPLEKNVALFERGVELSRVCKAKLSDAESRIQALVDPQESGAVRTEELDVEDVVDGEEDD